MRVTIKSIARDLGISHMTVSRALSGSKQVNPATRQKICDYAEQVGYVRSSAASAMRGDPTAIVGLLLPNIVNDFYARFANALSLMCAEAGFDLVIHLTGDDIAQEVQCLTRLQALQVRIVLRVPAPRREGQAPYPVNGPDLINLIRTVEGETSRGDLMIHDDLAIRQAVAHLQSQGHSRIAYIGGAEALSSGRLRLRAFTRGLAENGLDIHDELVFTGSPGQRVGHECALALLDMDKGPDALICGGFELSSGALNACLERSIALPEQLAFVGYGDPAFHQWICGGVTTIALSGDEVARCAMRMITGEDTSVAESGEGITARFIVRRTA
ncbi:LacI family DNA-binding transcriptional regulator [Granulosicoccus sp. 3-233]|uniref:LacI family DNA-binding transcriptional regulator n=1 Tax=Granulosicoccus sp. 3-233 TaxID=3417969 RepID=UPI003D34F5FE